MQQHIISTWNRHPGWRKLLFVVCVKMITVPLNCKFQKNLYLFSFLKLLLKQKFRNSRLLYLNSCRKGNTGIWKLFPTLMITARSSRLLWRKWLQMCWRYYSKITKIRLEPKDVTQLLQFHDKTLMDEEASSWGTSKNIYLFNNYFNVELFCHSECTSLNKISNIQGFLFCSLLEESRKNLHEALNSLCQQLK